MPEPTIILPLTADRLRDKVLVHATDKSNAKAVEREYLGEFQLPVQTLKPADFDANVIDEVVPKPEESAIKAFLLRLVSPHNLQLGTVSFEVAPKYETAQLRGWRVTAQVS